ncbi:MAG: tripartite tricarboxylate transporter TctB family protein [Betaproteobacteria bacterium]|jgi:putative tricarboxylic transport membrane protein|nr:tripartite tricarboxylate transporter TctB family protein [Betaproteobacteria bacterium]
MRMKFSLGAGRIGALLFLGVVLVYGWGGTQLTAALQGDVIGPAFFPRLLTALGILLSILLLLQGGSDGKKDKADDGGSDITALVPAAMLLAYALVFEDLGFLIATPLFLVITFRYFGHPSWTGILGYSAAVTGVVFGLFHYLLDIRLPLGPLARFFQG